MIFYCHAVHFDNVTLSCTDKCNFIELELLKFTIKTLLHLFRHVSVHSYHLQGAYVDPYSLKLDLA
jgi:hypothetical protein